MMATPKAASASTGKATANGVSGSPLPGDDMHDGVVFPAALKWLIGIGAQLTPMITVHEYTDLFLTVILGLGVVFEMPVLVFFLALMGVVSAGWMWRNIRYAILGIFIVAGALAPTPDISSMVIFASPMVALYLASIAIAWYVHPAQRKARAAKRAKA